MRSHDDVNEMLDRLAVLKKVVGKYMNYHFRDIPLTGDQSRLLFIIHEREHSQKEIAQCLHITEATLSVRIKRLEEAGYVERLADPRDKRHSILKITDSGLYYLNLCKDKMKKMEEVCSQRLTEEDHQAVLHMMDIVIENIKNDLKEENDA